MKKISQFK